MNENRLKNISIMPYNKMPHVKRCTTNENTRIYYVFSKAKAIKLREKGFSIVERKPNYQYPEYDMYGFEESTEFQKAFEEVTGCKYVNKVI